MSKTENKTRLLAERGCSEAVHWPGGRDGIKPFRETHAEVTATGTRFRSEHYRDGQPGLVPSALMLIEARSRRKAADLLFTPEQHAAAVAFEELAQKVMQGNMKMSRLDGMGGGGSGLSVTDAMLANRQRFDLMQARIGNLAVLSARGALAQPGRRAIRADVLTWRAVACREPLDHILAAHGWSVQTRYRARLIDGLRVAMSAISEV